MSTTKIFACAFAVTSLLSTAARADDSDLSDAETSYSGAVMLQGDLEVYVGNVTTSPFVEDDSVTSYGFFTGNTMYAGSEDAEGNSVDAIVEFFWFESSIDRGSDFYVAVIKARTSPADGYALDYCSTWTSCDGPALGVYANADTSSGIGAFRWDWSLPFEDYGIDAYGSVTLTSSYGIGVGSEGSALAHAEYETDEDGNVKAEADIQAKGYVNTEYMVQTQYQVTLYEWDVEVDGGADHMYWDITLNRGEASEDNAYHEFFLVIQSDEDEVFTVDSIDIFGTIDPGAWTGAFPVGVALEGIELARPDSIEEDETEDEEWDTGYAGDDEEDQDDDLDEDETDLNTDNVLADGSSLNLNLNGCSTARAPLAGLVVWLSLGLVALRRRD
jgi:hypothetical protein